MQHPTAHHPITTENLPWQEQFLIRLDEIVGLLDSIESRLARWEEVRFQLSGCQGEGTQETLHADTSLPPIACPLPSPDGEEQPQ